MMKTNGDSEDIDPDIKNGGNFYYFSSSKSNPSFNIEINKNNSYDAYQESINYDILWDPSYLIFNFGEFEN